MIIYVQKKILSREDTEEISCRTSSRKRAGKLLDYLQENPRGLDTLVESIRREKTQSFLIQKITDEVLKLRNIKLEHLKGLKCSSCEPFAAGATNNLSRCNSDESNLSEKQRASTVMYHPEGESSTAPFFSMASSLNLPVLEVGRTENSSFSSATLPRPGDPGAPPLPPDLRLEEGEVVETQVRCFSPYGHVLFHANDTSPPSCFTSDAKCCEGGHLSIQTTVTGHSHSMRAFKISVHILCK